jgi:hypothetical protein
VDKYIKFTDFFVFTDYYVDRLTLTQSDGLTVQTAMLGIALPIGKQNYCM